MPKKKKAIMNDNDMVSVPRSVLQKIQWCNDEYYRGDECAICHEECSNGHKEDCPIGKALNT